MSSDCVVDVEVTVPAPIEVAVSAAPVQVVVDTPKIEVVVDSTKVDVEVTPPAVIEVEVSAQGVPGRPGEAGPGGGQELFDSATAPLTPPDTYLRFDRDGDGDVQAIYLGTVT